MNSILVVEDSPESFELIRRGLGPQVKLDWAKNANEAYRRLTRQKFDLILLDIELPDGNGYEICSVLQTSEEISRVPIIFLTAKNSTADKVMGFSVGAEDFLSKPVDPIELKARVDARLRKRRERKMRSPLLRVGDLEIDKDTQRITVNRDDERREIDLTPIEFRLLIYMASRIDQLVSRDEILNAIWGENVHVYGRSVDTHMSKLRKKLGTSAAPLRSVHGRGYQFSLDAEPMEAGSLKQRPWTASITNHSQLST